MDLPLTDFRLAGFLLARGVTFIRTEEQPNGEIIFLFDNTDGLAQKTLNEYPNSPEQRYDTSCKTMHNFISAIKRSKSYQKRRTQ
jgi:hypothetical protein